MANFVALQDLVGAIASAVTDAQQQVQKVQVANLAAYLDGEQRPLALELRLPSIRSEAAPGEEDLYRAPLLALVPHSLLRIKQVEVSFDIELGDLTSVASAFKADETVPVAPRDADAMAAQVKKSLNVNPAVGATVKQQGTSAHVVLTIEALETPESLSRLVLDLTKTQGVTGPVGKESKD